MTRIVVVLEGTPTPDPGAGVLLVTLSSKAGGITVRRRGKGLDVTLGYPEVSDYQYLRPTGDVSGRPNAISKALVEMITAHKVGELRFRDPVLWPTIRKACREANTEAYYYGMRVQLSESRPVWSEMRGADEALFSEAAP